MALGIKPKKKTQRESRKKTFSFKVQSLSLFFIGLSFISIEVVLVFHHHGPFEDYSFTDDPQAKPDGYLDGYPFHYHDVRKQPTSASTGSTIIDSSRRLHTSNNNNKDKRNETTTISNIWSQMHCIGENFGDLSYHRRMKNYLDFNWMTRSCHFQFLCYDIMEKDFVVFFPPSEEEVEEDDAEQGRKQKHPHPPTSDHHYASTVFHINSTVSTIKSTSTSTSSTTTLSNLHHRSSVSLGGINPNWGHEGYPRLEWFPRVVHESPTHFYTLPNHVTLIPFHSLSASNPGHLVWDDFLPIFTLMEIFFGTKLSHDDENKEDDQRRMELLLMRYVLPGGTRGLWASCDWNDLRKEECRLMLDKFGPLMVGNSPQLIPITTQESPRLEWTMSSTTPTPTTSRTQTSSTTDTATTSTNNTMGDTKTTNTIPNTKSQYICARHALAGIGALTDHGTTKMHGWQEKDYQIIYNAGRGGQLWRFRNFMLSNLGLLPKKKKKKRDGNDSGSDSEMSSVTRRMMNAPPSIPLIILFSEASTTTISRNVRFQPYIDALLEEPDLLPSTQKVDIRRMTMKSHTLIDQVKVVQRTAIYITTCGGGAVTATFLPRGATLIIFYEEDGGITGNRPNGHPARLDWDYFNNMGYTRVHWLPKPKIYNTDKISEDIRLFVELIRHEVEILTRQRQEWEKG